MTINEQADPVDPLKAIWAGEQPPARVGVEDLRVEAARQRRGMLLVVAGEVVVTVGLIALSLVLVASDGPISPGTVTLLATLWLTWLVAAGFAMWNRWGMWKPAAETARSYLALLEERARRRGRVANFVLGLISVHLVVVLILGEVRGIGLAVVALYAAWAVWYRRKAHCELEAIRRMAAEFHEEGENV